MSMEQPAKRYKKNVSGERLSAIILDDYMSLHQKAAEGAFVVWVAIIVPVELFAGFDKVVFAVPESHAALTSAKGVGVKQCERAEARGYSMDLCSYARIDIGTNMGGLADSPTMGLPKPHLLVSNNNNCSLLVKWFDVYHRMWGTPHFALDVPFCYGPQKPGDLAYIVAQFHDLIRTIEDLSGQKFDIDKAREAGRYSHEAARQWKRFTDLASHKPSGITAFDSFVQMAPLLTSRGTQRLAEHYRLLVEETEVQMRNGIFPVPNERYRLLWDNIAPWHQLWSMSSRLKKLDANITCASYTYCIGALEGDDRLYEYMGDDPFLPLARLQNFSVCPHGMALRAQAMQQVIKRNAIDGVVFASNRSCKVYSLMQLDLMHCVKDEFGIPCIMIDVDHADVRKYSEEMVFTRLEALLELIDERRS